MRSFCTFLVCAVAAVGAAAPTAEEIMQRSSERDSENLEVRRQYTYRMTSEVKQQKGNESKQRDLRTYDVFWLDGTEYKRLLEKDGKSLAEKQAHEEQAKLDREIDKQKHESESDRRKRQEKERRDLEDERQVRREVTQAYNFSLLGEEVVNGRSC